jgi:hypothetical protein
VEEMLVEHIAVNCRVRAWLYDESARRRTCTGPSRALKSPSLGRAIIRLLSSTAEAAECETKPISVLFSFGTCPQLNLTFKLDAKRGRWVLDQ